MHSSCCKARGAATHTLVGAPLCCWLPPHWRLLVRSSVWPHRPNSSSHLLSPELASLHQPSRDFLLTRARAMVVSLASQLQQLAPASSLPRITSAPAPALSHKATRNKRNLQGEQVSEEGGKRSLRRASWRAGPCAAQQLQTREAANHVLNRAEPILLLCSAVTHLEEAA